MFFKKYGRTGRFYLWITINFSRYKVYIARLTLGERWYTILIYNNK